MEGIENSRKRKRPSVCVKEEPLPSVCVKEEPLPSVCVKEEPLPSVCVKEEPLPSVCVKEEPLPSVCVKEEPLPSVCVKEEPLPSVCVKEEPLPSVCVKEEPDEHYVVFPSQPQEIKLEESDEYRGVCFFKEESDVDEEDSDVDEEDLPSQLQDSSDEGLPTINRWRCQGQDVAGDAPYLLEAWKSESDPDTVDPQSPTFIPRRTPGYQLPLTTSLPTPADLFDNFFDDEVLKLVCSNTNKYANKQKESMKLFVWNDFTPQELKKYLGLLLFMSVCKLPKIDDFWKKNTIFHVPFPASVMSRDRFRAIASNIHVSDPEEDLANEQRKGTEEYDSLQKVRALLEEIRTRCKHVYHPQQHISVNKRMVATKARLTSKQYMKARPTQSGLNFFVLADINGYTVDFQLHTGKSHTTSGKGLSFDVVSELVNKNFLGSGYIVHCDNLYRVSSPRPTAVGKYSKYMGGVDTSDEMLQTTTVHRRTRRWPVTVFQHCLDIAVTNSYILHKHISSKKQKEAMTRQEFQEKLCAQLLGVDENPPVTSAEGHIPVPCSSGEGLAKAQRASQGRKRCTLCKKSTPWMCEECNRGFCLQLDRNCFAEYHSS